MLGNRPEDLMRKVEGEEGEGEEEDLDCSYVFMSRCLIY
jgi:hypothetical protein